MNKEKPLDKKIEELKKEIKKEKNAKTQKVYDHNGKEKYVQRDYKRIYELKAKLSAYEDAQKIFSDKIENAGLEDVIYFLNNLKDFTVNDELPFGTCDYMSIDDMISKIKELIHFGKLAEEELKNE